MFKRPLGGHIYQQTTRASQKRGAQDLLGVIDMMGLGPVDRYDRDMHGALVGKDELFKS